MTEMKEVLEEGEVMLVRPVTTRMRQKNGATAIIPGDDWQWASYDEVQDLIAKYPELHRRVRFLDISYGNYWRSRISLWIVQYRFALGGGLLFRLYWATIVRNKFRYVAVLKRYSGVRK